MNIQVLTAPDGTPLWTSGSLPGSVHDLKAARVWGIVRRLKSAGLIALADKGYVGAGEPVRVPYKGEEQASRTEERELLPRRLRRPGECANAQLKPGASSANYAAALFSQVSSSKASCLATPRSRMKSTHSPPIWRAKHEISYRRSHEASPQPLPPCCADDHVVVRH
ncbi:hypothetical protein GCM10010412_100740 [Nonomuraea recticatena]|uniref:DDE Tnp4 domain-containing protein n=1 Tax=Nonomuraea recticatena TaxID=46178 RepID=A0ABN3TGF8_9ACTN